MNRRDFSKLIGAAVAGLAVGSHSFASEEAGEGGEKHVCKGTNECKGQGGCQTSANECKGQNDCKGQGGCATVSHHECAGKNDCKGQGGCRTGDNGCMGKNSCKGKGGCAVPLEHT